MFDLLVLAVFASSAYGYPQTSVIDSEGMPINFIGEVSNDIATTVFQGYEGNQTNFIFSPFGYSVILAILAEGARGETRNELSSALRLPENIDFVRETFKSTLQRMTEKGVLNKPEFKNYFYVYKNFTVEQEYKDVMLKYYLTDVKATERPDYNEDENVYSSESDSVTAESVTIQSVKELQPTPIGGENATEKIAQLLSLEKDISDGIEESGVSKIRRERIKRLAKRFLGIDLNENLKNEVASLSANRLCSTKYNVTLSRMLIFNGLYFKGSWETPFQNKQGEDNFYLSETDKKSVKMIYSVGKFYVGDIPELDCSVIRLPYQGERYSFLILLPNTRSGLTKLISDLTGYSLRNIHKYLQERHLQVTIPSFDFKTISHMKGSLKKYGITSIFSEGGDLSGISSNSGLFVDDLVQLVTIHVDNQVGTTNFLTASLVSTRTVTEKFVADHPFLFFLQDHKENLLVAAGKLIDPSAIDD